MENSKSPDPITMVDQISKTLGLSLIPCESSNVVAMAHDYQQRYLYILFKNQTLYRYYDQDYLVFLDLLRAESKGKWVQEHLVKPQIEFKKWKYLTFE